MSIPHTRWGQAVVCLTLTALTAPAAAPPAPKSAAPDAAALARRIDRHIDVALRSRQIVPAARADDAEYARRVYLDLSGRIPRVSEVRAFLDDRRPDKRLRLVERLLASPNHVTHLTNVWRALLLPQNNNQQVQFLAGQIETWLRSRMRDNVPYDRLVRDLITAPVGAVTPGRPVVPAGRTFDYGALAFFQANEMKPENLAASTSRLFLGVTMECAQCHDHPFAKWSRRQFWEYTAFFAGIRSSNPLAGAFAPASDDPKVRSIALPGSEKTVQARFLDGAEPRWADASRPRDVLAAWMTGPDNPFFARAAVNRLWEQLFGIGLVDPADDFRDENPASHPALLDDLARAFVASGYDLRFLIRAITASETYQRSSELTHRSQQEPRTFARMPLRGLTPEQIYDSLATAVGYRGDASAAMQGGFIGNNSARASILNRFANPVDRRTEAQTSILQALALMHGKFVSDATSLERSETLAAVVDSPFLDARGKLDTLFLAALSRPMRGSEAGRLIPYVQSGGPGRDTRRALADVFWVLLNSSEFLLNR